MRVTVFTGALALCALAAIAAEPQQAAAKTDKTQPANTAPEQTLTPPPAPQQQTDSPLVAAAKRTGRLGKKPAIVITNDTLVKTGGHFTTTQAQAAPLPKAKAAEPERWVPPAKPVDDKQKAAKERAMKRAVSDYSGESIENVTEDPAAMEGMQTTAAPKQTTTVKQPGDQPTTAPKPPGE